MSQITTHVLDTTLGLPAIGLPIRLLQQQGTEWRLLGQGVTNNDGRIKDLLAPEVVLAAGTYQVHFDTATYLQASGQALFYPEVSVVFTVSGNGQHYHIPLLLNPYGYSTYRGS